MSKKKQKESKKIELTPQYHKTIDKVAKYHCRKTFGYYDRDDLYQEIWIIALDVLDHGKFNVKLGYSFEHFLRKVVSARLVNLYKTVFKRINPPSTCQGCDQDCRDACPQWQRYYKFQGRIYDLQKICEFKGE